MSAANIAASRKSGWRKNGMADCGQRYVVIYRDGKAQRRCYGFTADEIEAQEWLAKIRANPIWTQARIVDRAGKGMR